MPPPIILVLGEDIQVKEFMDEIGKHHQCYRCRESEEDALKRCDFVLMVENQWFPHRSRRTNKIIDLTQINLSNGGARSDPPREIVELTSISLSPLSRLREGLMRDGFYAMRLDGTGFRSQQPAWYAPYHLAQRMPEIKTLLVALSSDKVMYHRFGEAAAEYVVELLRYLTSRE